MPDALAIVRDAVTLLVTGLGYLTLVSTLVVLVAVLADALTTHRSPPPPCQHERETVEPWCGCLVARCLDCQAVRTLGPVYSSAYCHQAPRRRV